MVDIRPTQGAFGIHDARVVSPGDPSRSVLLYRICKLGNGHMPHIGATEIDRTGLELICEWIRQIPPKPFRETPDDQVVGEYRNQASTALERLMQMDDSIHHAEAVNCLLSSTNGALMLLRAVDDKTLPSAANSLVISKAIEHNDLHVRDLLSVFSHQKCGSSAWAVLFSWRRFSHFPEISREASRFF